MVHTHGVEGSTPPLATNLAEASDFSEASLRSKKFCRKGYAFTLLCDNIVKNTVQETVEEKE